MNSMRQTPQIHFAMYLREGNISRCRKPPNELLGRHCFKTDHLILKAWFKIIAERVR